MPIIKSHTDLSENMHFEHNYLSLGFTGQKTMLLLQEVVSKTSTYISSASFLIPTVACNYVCRIADYIKTQKGA